MRIQISSGIGVGPTEMAAFDQALIQASVANYNLIYLSSILPPGSEVVHDPHPQKPEGNWGDRLYVVMAQKRTSLRNQEAWAGIGWMQDKKTGKGMLTEHEGHSEAEVRADIEHSLTALAKNRGMEFGPHQLQVIGTKCTGQPVCALVVAVFESSSWRGMRQLSNLKLPKLSR